LRVGLLVLELFLHGTSSLKEKRRVVRSLRDRISNRYNVATAEVDHQDLHQRCTIAFVSVAGSEDPLQRMFDGICEEAESVVPGRVEVASREIIA
jgi:uncharacterized protein YlxP (DUF503 family)